MTLRELLRLAGIDMTEPFKPELDYQLVTHQAGEKAYEIVAAEVVWQNKSIYLENE